MTGLAPRASFRRQPGTKLLSPFAEELISVILLVIFVWLCVGPGLDYILALFGTQL